MTCCTYCSAPPYLNMSHHINLVHFSIIYAIRACVCLNYKRSQHISQYSWIIYLAISFLWKYSRGLWNKKWVSLLISVMISSIPDCSHKRHICLHKALWGCWQLFSSGNPFVWFISYSTWLMPFKDLVATERLGKTNCWQIASNFWASNHSCISPSPQNSFWLINETPRWAWEIRMLFCAGLDKTIIWRAGWAPSK